MPRAPRWLVAGLGLRLVAQGCLWVLQCRRSRHWQLPIPAESLHPIPGISPTPSQESAPRGQIPDFPGSAPSLCTLTNTFCPINSCGPYPETANIFCVPAARLGNKEWKAKEDG